MCMRSEGYGSFPVCVFVHSASSVTHATKRQTKHTGGLSIIVDPELIWHFFV